MSDTTTRVKKIELEQLANPEMLRMLKEVQSYRDIWLEKCKEVVRQANEKFNGGGPFFIYNDKMALQCSHGEFVFAHIKHGDHDIDYYKQTNDVFKLSITIEPVEKYRLIRDPQ